MEINARAAADLLAALDPKAKQHCFQTFTDADDKPNPDPLAAARYGGLKEHGPQLRAHNQKGAGVFVTINATDGTGRKRENVTAVRAVFVDFDTPDPKRPETLAALPLPPSWLVETSPGKHHAYWFADGLALEEFKPLQLRLAQAFGGDPVVKDLGRVMRLPGFWHRKGEPFQVRTVRSSGRRYSAAELREWVGSLPVGTAEPEKPPQAPSGAIAAPLAPQQDRYAARALESALEAVATAPEGQRNDTLNAQAFGLYGLALAGRLDAGEVTAAMEEAALLAGLDLGEIHQTLSSAKGRATPRHEGRQGAVANLLPNLPIPANGPRLPAAEQAGAGGQAERRFPLRLVSAAELIQNPVPPDWQIRGFMERGTLGMVFGDPKAGKTFLVIDLAAHHALGIDWRGNRTRPGRVVYVAGEGHRGIARRLTAWSLYQGVAAGDLAESFVISDRSVPFSSAPALAELWALLAAMPEPPTLLVIDTLARAMVGMKEATEDMGQFIAVCEAIQHTFGCTVLLVHHTGRVEKDRARGPSALDGAVDFSFSVRKESSGLVRFSCQFQKDAEEPEPLLFRLQSVELPREWNDDEGNPAFSAVPIPAAGEIRSTPKPPRGKHARNALGILRRMLTEHAALLGTEDADGLTVTVDDWRSRCESESDPVPRQRFYEARQRLDESGHIRISADGLRVALPTCQGGFTVEEDS